MLLYGPPGNGKSMLCRAMISTIGWPIISSCTRALHRGDERPSTTDVRAALAQLTQHRGAAKREFQNGRAAGFGV